MLKKIIKIKFNTWRIILTIDGFNWISYFTIELKKEIPNSVKGQFEDWMFGCDICQDVYHEFGFQKPMISHLFNRHADLLLMAKIDW